MKPMKKIALSSTKGSMLLADKALTGAPWSTYIAVKIEMNSAAMASRKGG